VTFCYTVSNNTRMLHRASGTISVQVVFCTVNGIVGLQLMCCTQQAASPVCK